MEDWRKQIVVQYGEEYVIRQLAEEAAELCQAALKMVRVMNSETPVRWAEAQQHLLEEMADVGVMMRVMNAAMLNAESQAKILDIGWKKEERMKQRMLEDVPEPDSNPADELTGDKKVVREGKYIRCVSNA